MRISPFSNAKRVTKTTTIITLNVSNESHCHRHALVLIGCFHIPCSLFEMVSFRNSINKRKWCLYFYKPSVFIYHYCIQYQLNTTALNRNWIGIELEHRSCAKSMNKWVCTSTGTVVIGNDACASKDQLETDVQTFEIYCKQQTISNDFTPILSIRWNGSGVLDIIHYN